MMRVLLCAVLAGALGGCGTFAANSDVPSGVYAGVADRPVIPDDPTVKIVSAGPSIGVGGVAVSGESCKNKIWQPAPTNENAMALMKRQAAERGLHAIHSVSVHDDPGALGKNCWSAIIAEGIAFKPPVR